MTNMQIKYQLTIIKCSSFVNKQCGIILGSRDRAIRLKIEIN